MIQQIFVAGFAKIKYYTFNRENSAIASFFLGNRKEENIFRISTAPK